MDSNEKYSFPLLKTEEIVDFFNKLGYRIDKTIIESTDSEVIVEIYSSILDKLNIIKKDKLKIRFDGINLFSYPGLHDRPIYILQLFNSVKRFIKETIQIESFASSDLFTPNPKRTRRILSGLINFFKYKQNEKDTLDTIKSSLSNSQLVYEENIQKFQKAQINYDKLK